MNKGGSFRFVFWYQGEQEATSLNPLHGDAWPAATQACLQAIASKAGVPLRAIVAQLCSVVPGAGARQYPNWTRFRDEIQPRVEIPKQIVLLPGSDGPMEPNTHEIHLSAAASDDLGARAAELAIAQGWI